MTELEQVVGQEEKLVLPRFDETIAFDLVRIAWEMAVQQNLGIIADVRTFDRQLAFLSRPGTAANNCEWVRRKSNTVRRFLKSSYRIVLEQGGEGVFPAASGVNALDYAIAGGAFPLRTESAGIVGSITISGMSGAEDHDFAVRTLARYLDSIGKNGSSAPRPAGA